MRVQIQHLTQSLNKLKNFTDKPKTIKVDARIIAKLATQSRKRRNYSEITGQNIPTSRVTQTENASTTTSSSCTSNDRLLVDNSENGNLKTKLRAKAWDKFKFRVVKKCPETDSVESKTEQTENTGQIEQNSRYSKDRVSAFSTDSIGHLQKKVEVRNTSTNT